MCQEGWECEDCLYNKGYCTYTEEMERVNLQEIAATIEERHIEKAKEDAEKIIRKNELGSLEWFYSTKPPDNSVLEPINAMSGAISFGGGSNNGRRKQPVKKMPEYLKTFGL